MRLFLSILISLLGVGQLLAQDPVRTLTSDDKQLGSIGILRNFTGVDFSSAELSNLTLQADRLDSAGFVFTALGTYALEQPEARAEFLAAFGSGHTQESIYFVSFTPNAMGVDFSVVIEEDEKSRQQNRASESFVRINMEAYYIEHRDHRLVADAIAYGIEQFLLLKGANSQEEPLYLADEEALVDVLDRNIAGHQMGSHFFRLDESTNFVNPAGLVIPLKEGSHASFFSRNDETKKSLLRAFKLRQREGGDEVLRLYTPFKFTEGSPACGECFSGYGYVDAQTGSIVKYNYNWKVEEEGETGSSIPFYEPGEQVKVMKGFVFNCDEGRRLAKFRVKENLYQVGPVDRSDPNASNFINFPQGRYLGVGEFSDFTEVEGRMSYNTAAWDVPSAIMRPLGPAFDTLGRVFCGITTEVDLSSVFSRLSDESSYIIGRTNSDVPVIMTVVGGVQTIIYEPYADAGGLEYLQFHPHFGWYAVEAGSLTAFEVIWNGLVSTTKLLAIGSFIGLNILAGNAAAGYVILAHRGSLITSAAITGVIDVGFAGVEGLFVFVVSDDRSAALNTFLVGAASAGFGSAIEIGFEALRAVRYTGDALGAIDETVDVVLTMGRVGEDRDVIVDLNKLMDEIEDLPRWNRSKSEHFLADLSNFPEVNQYILSGENYLTRVRAWEALPAGLRTDVPKLTKVSEWTAEGLHHDKIRTAFQGHSNPTELFDNLDNAQSIQHQRVLVADFDNIPGVESGNYVPNGLTAELSHPAWGNPDLDLTIRDAPNFTDAIPRDLPPGTKLYRVTGGNPAGGYWTRTIPNDVGEVIGGTAVRPEWNSFERLYEYTVPSEGLKVWQGGTARQRVTDGVDNYFLPGGDEQILVPYTLRTTDDFANAISEIPLTW